jgi:hypothetical protein
MNRTILMTALLCTILFQFSYSQISVQEQVTTDTVNLFTDYSQSMKSSKLAIGFSLILPGSGHQYLGRNRSALAYLAIDMFSLFGAIYGESYSRKLYTDSRGYAGLLAGAAGKKNDNSYWQIVGEFDNVESYNDAMKLNRESDKLYNDGQKYWLWASDDDREKYNNIRKQAQKYKLVSSICIGTMVLNRLVAILDIRASSKYKVVKALSSVEFNPSISPDLSSTGIVMSTQF